jgi:hypothetical protein
LEYTAKNTPGGVGMSFDFTSAYTAQAKTYEQLQQEERRKRIEENRK